MKTPYKQIGSFVGLLGVSAGEHIRSRVPVLRPSVNRYVGLGYSKNSGDALGVELMERLADNVDAYLTCYLDQGVLNEVEIIQQELVTTFEFQQYLGT
jgi:hypothetical protein